MVRWVTPLLYVGTEADAQGLGYRYVSSTDEATASMAVDRGVVVPTREIAAGAIRHFGATEAWIESHVMSEWEGEPTFD
jgi:hypothetical protein